MKRELFNFDWKRSLGRVMPWEKNLNEKPVSVPDDFVLEMKRDEHAKGGAMVGYTGDEYATYTKIFDMPASWSGKQVQLYLDGAYMYTEILFNEQRIGQHPYGYTPYTVDLTPYLREDIPNTLEISTQTMQPSTRWYSGGGLYRNVEILLGEPCYLDPRDLLITTPKVSESEATVHVELLVTNAAETEKKVTIVSCLHNTHVVSSAAADAQPGKTKVELEMAVPEPELWDDEHPNLYEIEIRVQADGQDDDVTTKMIGIRKITVSARDGMRINGRPLTLYGGCIHHDNGPVGSRALPDAEYRKIQNLKAAGFNAIRTAHNPPSTALLDACDRLGVLVLDEFFDCWRTGKNHNDYHLWFEDWWERDIEYTVCRDRNHPCIYAWSFGNEITEANGYSNCEYWMKAQADKIRSLDPTRLVTCGGMFLPAHMTCDGLPGGPYGPPAREDPYTSDSELERKWTAMIENLDIVSLNYSFRNYEQFHKLFPDKPLQGTETQGIDAWGNRNAVRNNPHVVGDFMWTAHDNLGEAGAGRSYWDPEEGKGGLMAGWPWLSCYQGDLALDGERLPRSYYRKVIWGKDEGIHLFTTHPEHAGQKVLGTAFHWHDVRRLWTYPEAYIGKPIDVEAYCDCEYVEFYVNGQLQASAEPVEMIAYAQLTYQPGTITAQAYRNGVMIAEDMIETTGDVEVIGLDPDRRSLLADGMNLCYMTVTLEDSEGRRVYDRDREITVHVSGAAVLEGLASNNPCTSEDFGTGRRMTYNGHAMIVLRAGRIPGEASISVSDGTLESRMIIPVGDESF